MKDKQYNMTFGVLSSLAIIMVVAGHVGYSIMTVGGLVSVLFFSYTAFYVYFRIIL